MLHIHTEFTEWKLPALWIMYPCRSRMRIHSGPDDYKNYSLGTLVLVRHTLFPYSSDPPPPPIIPGKTFAQESAHCIQQCRSQEKGGGG